MIESRSPQSPDEVVVTAPDMGRDEVGAAVASCHQAARSWRQVPAPARARALEEVASAIEAAAAELSDLMVREVGKPLNEARGEVGRTVSIWRYYAQQGLDPDGATYPSADGHSLLMHRRRPHGVAGLITPWNFPAAIPSWKAAPALACGNAALLKPAPESTAVALRLAECATPHLPEGLLKVVTGDAGTGQCVVELADVVSVTGSVPAGQAVARAATERGVPVQAEMGGQNASLVLPDADLEQAAAAVAGAAMGYAGQKCTATSRAVVVGDPAPFTEALVAAVEALPVGDPAEPANVSGPLISAEAHRVVLDAVQEARSRGGKVLAGGTPADPGWTVLPTLVGGLDPGDRLAQEEVFGPLCLVLPADDVDRAVSIANGVRYGLVTSIFTSDLDRALQLMDRVDTGMVKVNAPTSGVDFYAPFGGEKASSLGPREQGKAARHFYTWTQTMTVAPAAGGR
jgi:acyl-CoA reductase-like NAD-dependent aldehyde dehydrogenase